MGVLFVTEIRCLKGDGNSQKRRVKTGSALKTASDKAAPAVKNAAAKTASAVRVAAVKGAPAIKAAANKTGSAIKTSASRVKPAARSSCAFIRGELDRTPDRSMEFDPRDVQETRIMSMLSYVSIVCLVPLILQLASPEAMKAEVEEKGYEVKEIL